MEIADIIKELDSELRIMAKEIEENVMYIKCEKGSASAKCKYCGVESGKVHSKYRREIGDLPIMQHKVKLMIYVKKYRCENPECGHKRFAERLKFAGEQSKRTERLDEYIREIVLKNSSVESEKIVRKTHTEISSKTILRMIKKSE